MFSYRIHCPGSTLAWAWQQTASVCPLAPITPFIAMKLAARQFVATAPSTRGHLRTHQRVADSRGLATLHGSGGNGGRPQTQKAPRLIQAAADVFAYDNVTTVFTAFNTLLLVPWCMMVFVPNLDFTRSVIRSNIFLYLFCCMFLYLFTAATVEALEAGASLSDEIQFLFLEAVAGSHHPTPGCSTLYRTHKYLCAVLGCTYALFAGTFQHIANIMPVLYTYEQYCKVSDHPVGDPKHPKACSHPSLCKTLKRQLWQETN